VVICRTDEPSFSSVDRPKLSNDFSHAAWGNRLALWIQTDLAHSEGNCPQKRTANVDFCSSGDPRRTEIQVSIDPRGYWLWLILRNCLEHNYLPTHGKLRRGLLGDDPIRGRSCVL
jgi:hypothetical protein